MLTRKIIALFLILSVFAESSFTYYQDCWYGETTNSEVNFSEIDELKESDTSFYFHSRDYFLSPRTNLPAESETTRFHFSESAPDDACCSVASPPPEVF